jgi:hypothetical protein
MESLDAEVDRQVEAWKARIAELRGRHVAIEVLWDGDTEGWWLGVSVVTKRSWWGFGFTPPYYARPIATLRYGGDVRLFQGTVPPWPEAIVAQRAGERVARLLGLELYFPSPIEPDDDCPHVWNRERASPCRTCGKPLNADRSPHVPADRCLPCFQEETYRSALLADAPGSGSGGVTCVVESGGAPGAGVFFGLDLDPPLRGLLAAVLRDRRPTVELTADVETTLTPDEVRAMQAACERRIDERLPAYRPAEVPEFAAHSRSYSWRGKEWSIQTRFDPPGEELAGLFQAHRIVRAALGGGLLHVFGNGGTTDRDASFLAALARGPCTREELRAAYPFLSVGAIDGTLSKLEQRGFLVRDGDRFRPTIKGRCVQIPGP